MSAVDDLVEDRRILLRVTRRADDAATRTGQRLVDELPPPATPDMVVAAEARLGFALHPFLRRVYLEVANGGFGPGYGLASLADPQDATEAVPSLSAVYAELKGDGWPDQLLPLWDWGGGTWSCLANQSPEGIIVSHDQVVGPTETRFTLRSWLDEWAAGVSLWEEIYEDKDAMTINPFTRLPVVTRIYGRAKGR